MTVERIDAETGEVLSGELVPFRPATVDRTAEGVVALLTHARDWLATAVEVTGPAEIAQAKAALVLADTYARELQLSKDIQMDSTEMVRRAEYALGRAIRKGQDEGTIAAKGNPSGANGHGEGNLRVPQKSSPYDFAKHTELYGDGREGGNGVLAMADNATPERFEEAITEARGEDNLSRANVVRKVKGGPGIETRTDRAQKVADLAVSGHSSRQIASLVGIGRTAVVSIARDFDIDITADRIVGKARRVDTNRVISTTVSTLEGITTTLPLIDPDDIDPESAQTWSDSLTRAIEALRKLNRQIKESIQ